MEADRYRWDHPTMFPFHIPNQHCRWEFTVTAAFNYKRICFTGFLSELRIWFQLIYFSSEVLRAVPQDCKLREIFG